MCKYHNNNSYNGFANRETWNVALWINNDEGLYHMSKEYDNYSQLVEFLKELGILEAPDGVKYNDLRLNIRELNEVIKGNK